MQVKLSRDFVFPVDTLLSLDYGMNGIDVWISSSTIQYHFFDRATTIVIMFLAGMPLEFSKLSIRPQTPGFAPIPDREREIVRGDLFKKLVTRPSHGMPAQSVHGRIIR